MMTVVWNASMMGILVLASCSLFSEADILGTPTTAIGALVAGFTAMTGLMVWIVKRLLDTTLPNMQATFQTALDRQQLTYQTAQDNFSKMMKDTQSEFRIDLEKNTISFLKESEAMRALFEKRTTQEREFFDKELNAILNEVRTDRASAIAAISTNQAALLRLLDAKLLGITSPANLTGANADVSTTK